MVEGSMREEKVRLRQRCAAVRQGLSAAQVEEAGRAVLGRVLELAEYRAARLVHTYVSSKGNEVDTHGLIASALEAGKHIAVPVVRRGTRVLEHALIGGLEDLRPSRWGLYSPREAHPAWLHDLGEVDLVVVPGLAFDTLGNRLGLGGGYYDRFLARLPAIRIGLGYECLRLERIPREPHDAVMDLVVTEAGVYRSCGGGT